MGMTTMGKTAFVDNDPNPNDANKPGLSSSYFLGKYIEPEKWNPSQLAVGVYDFSSTYAATFVHSADDDYAFELSQAEIQNLTKLWWDGSSANWTVACSVFDEDKGYPEGAASIQHQRYAQAIL